MSWCFVALLSPIIGTVQVLYHILRKWSSAIAAPSLRPLFKSKQIVEGSDGCGLFVDNLIFLRLYCFAFFDSVSIGLCCFKIQIMNLTSVLFDLCYFCFNVWKLQPQSFSRHKMAPKASIFSLNCYDFFIVLPDAKISLWPFFLENAKISFKK
jgi:hypothetical protein